MYDLVDRQLQLELACLDVVHPEGLELAANSQLARPSLPLPKLRAAAGQQLVRVRVGVRVRVRVSSVLAIRARVRVSAAHLARPHGAGLRDLVESVPIERVEHDDDTRGAAVRTWLGSGG